MVNLKHKKDNQMANLFLKTKEKTISLLSTPFKSEEAFEKKVFDTPEILEDIYLIKRQIRGGNKTSIPDIIGIDNDGNICIIEMKNILVDAKIIPQVLEYAIWAETNPDSIKSLWLEKEDKPDDLELIDWDDFKVRILIIAPDISRVTLKFVDKVNYEIDLIEIKRWIDNENEIFLVNKLENTEKVQRIRTTSGLEIYDEAFYKKNRNKESVDKFLKLTNELDNFVKRKNWNLELKYNKHYCGFKVGFFNAFGIHWIGTKTFAFFFKLTEDEAKECKKTEMTKYQTQWKQALYYIDDNTKLDNFECLFQKAYEKLAGK